MNLQPIFIISLPRAGSTLSQRILCQRADIVVPPISVPLAIFIFISGLLGLGVKNNIYEIMTESYNRYGVGYAAGQINNVLQNFASPHDSNSSLNKLSKESVL